MCTQETYDQVHLQAEVDAEERDEKNAVLNNEWRAAVCVIQTAVRCIVKLLQDDGQSSQCLETEIILVGNDKRLYPSSKLIYIDKIECRKRCSEIGKEHDLHFVDETLLRSRGDYYDSGESDKWDVFCKFTKLRKLSDCVKERLGDGIEDENLQKIPSHSELKLEKFVKSAEFSRCVSILSNATRYSLAMNESKFFQMLNSVKFMWVLDLHTTLEVNEENLVATKEEKLAFFINKNLWVKSAQLDNFDVSQKFVRSLAIAIASYLCIPIYRRKEALVEMLEEWKKEPEHFVREFAEKNPQWSSEILSQETTVHDSPGMPVPIEQHRFLIQSTDCTFEVEEIVAVAGNAKDGMSSYIFGSVRKRSDGKSNGKPVAAHGTGLRRLYNVDCGGETPVDLPHCDLFKFDRRTRKQFQRSLQQTKNAPSSATGAQMHSMQEESSDWPSLFDTLKQMETLPVAEYRKFLKRLFLQWHPDKCNKPHASRFFHVLRRHEVSYKDDKDFSWLDRNMIIEEALAQTGAARNQSTYTESRWEYKGAEANSWFAEFEREKVREEELVRQQQEMRYAGSYSTAQPSASSRENREYDRELADKYWKMATYSKEGMLNNFRDQRWASCVWEAQQACELAIKSVMLRTCGISEEEKKGQGAHDLLFHMSRLIAEDSDEDSCPVDRDQLKFLSEAYILARYPLSGGVLPIDRYDRDDAQKSITAAKVRFLKK
jgi:HEPN domain-containing protein